MVIFLQSLQIQFGFLNGGLCQCPRYFYLLWPISATSLSETFFFYLSILRSGLSFSRFQLFRAEGACFPPFNRSNMDFNSIPSYHLHLAQISTGQREFDYTRLPVQTTDLIPQSDTLPPSYNSHTPAINWTESRSVLVSQSMGPHQDLGYSNPWGAIMPGSGEQQFSLPGRMRDSQPETMAYDYQSPSSTLPMASPPTMDQLSPRVVKSDPNMPFQQGHQLSPVWMNHEQNFNYHSMELEHATKLEDSDGIILSIPTAPPSPISTTSHHSNSHSSHSSTGIFSNPISVMADTSSPRNSSGDSEEDHPVDPPYSQLIYQALKETKGHQLQLQDIYTWFEKNTNKGKDQGKGWQNSIRHNLSMNAVSTKPPLYKCDSL